MSSNQKNIYHLILKSIISGIGVALFILSVSYATQLLWSTLPKVFHFPTGFYIPIICLIGGLLLSLTQKQAHGYPRTLHELSSTSYANLNLKSELKKTVIPAFIILSFGGSVGPEAPLAGLIVVLFQWVNIDVKNITSAPTSSSSVLNTLRSNTWSIRIIIFVSILLSFISTYSIFGSNMSSHGIVGIFSQSDSPWHISTLYFLPLGVLLGTLFGYYFNATDTLSHRYVNKFKIPIPVQPILGGVLLGLIGWYSLDFLFAGTTTLANQVQHPYPLYALLLLAIGKPLVTNISFHLGWRGGTIFPAIVSSYMFAMAIQSIFGFSSTAFCLALALSATILITGSPLVMAIVFMLFYPVSVLPIIAVIVLMNQLITKQIDSRSN